MPRARIVGWLAIALLVAGAGRAAAQAWVPPAHFGSVTFDVQAIDHYGRIDPGQLALCCRTINMGIDVDVDYGITDRFSISTGLPFELTKYHDAPYNVGMAAFLPYLAVDSCRCWHGGFQDVAFTARYNLINVNTHAAKGAFVVTPSVSVGVPTHDYEYVGEAVIGFGLKELRLGVDAGQRLDAILPGLAVQGRYSYAVVQRAIGIAHNRSNGAFEGDYLVTRHLSARGILSWQVTHGGLRFQDVPTFPDRITEFHRLLRDNYLQVGGGASYTWHQWDVSGAYFTTVRGSNTHAVRLYNISVGRSFGQ